MKYGRGEDDAFEGRERGRRRAGKSMGGVCAACGVEINWVCCPIMMWVELWV